MRRVITIAIAMVVAMAGIALTAGTAIAADQPDRRYHNKENISNLWPETTSCPGFAASSPLLFAGTIKTAYSSWDDPSGTGVIEEGYAQIHVSASDGFHSYRIHQRYEHPRAFREYVYGYATTVVVRDDGATMTGWSWLGIDPDKGFPGVAGAEGVWWLETPTCASGKK